MKLLITIVTIIVISSCNSYNLKNNHSSKIERINYKICATKEEEIQTAIVARDNEHAIVMIKNGFDANAKINGSWSVLISASIHGNPELVKIIIQYGANVNYICSDGRNALQFAAWRGNLDIVKLITEAGCDINYDINKGSDQTALDIACSYGYYDIAEYLLSKGAKIEYTNPKNSPLYNAALCGYVDIVNLLIINKADVNYKYKNKSVLQKIYEESKVKNRDGSLYPNNARFDRYDEIIEILRNSGAK